MKASSRKPYPYEVTYENGKTTRYDRRDLRQFTPPAHNPPATTIPTPSNNTKAADAAVQPPFNTAFFDAYKKSHNIRSNSVSTTTLAHWWIMDQLQHPQHPCITPQRHANNKHPSLHNDLNASSSN